MKQLGERYCATGPLATMTVALERGKIGGGYSRN
ncbi:hypothetical protein SVAN01_10000 [Stagonosporopsis vannaccii]|nr:hypothetical protein SVAN01_10000 [Stagonosporopsis vannaccii]